MPGDSSAVDAVNVGTLSASASTRSPFVVVQVPDVLRIICKLIAKALAVAEPCARQGEGQKRLHVVLTLCSS
jgi:hypothetical protein